MEPWVCPMSKWWHRMTYRSTRFLNLLLLFFFQAEDGIRDYKVTGVQTCALPISLPLERAYTIPSSWYFDSELGDLERRTAFAGWQAVGRLDQVNGPGSYFTADVAEIGRAHV